MIQKGKYLFGFVSMFSRIYLPEYQAFRWRRERWVGGGGEGGGARGAKEKERGTSHSNEGSRIKYYYY